MQPSAENHWEIRIKRQINAKKAHAFRVMTNQIAEWWWCPAPFRVAGILVDWRANGVFQVSAEGPHGIEVVQEGIVLDRRNAWYFYYTDAFRSGGRPATPTMIGFWSIASCEGSGVTHHVSIRHFSEADYLRNKSLGSEEGWNNAAYKLAALCKQW